MAKPFEFGMQFINAFNLEKPILANANKLQEMIANLSVGDGLIFVKDLSDKCYTEKWVGVRHCTTFGRGFYIVARHYDGYCDIWDSLDADLIDKITSLLWNRKEQKVDDVYVFEENKQDAEVYLFPDGSLHLTGYTDFGAEIFLPSVVGRDIFEALEMFYVEEDIKQRLGDTENTNTQYITFEDIRQMAQDVISAKCNCDGIAERYWGIVDDAIKNFLSNF